MHLSSIWISVNSCVHLSVLNGKDFIAGYYPLSLQPNSFISAMPVGIIGFHLSIPLSGTLNLCKPRLVGFIFSNTLNRN